MISPALADADGNPVSSDKRRRWCDEPANIKDIWISTDQVFTLQLWQHVSARARALVLLGPRPARLRRPWGCCAVATGSGEAEERRELWAQTQAGALPRAAAICRLRRPQPNPAPLLQRARAGRLSTSAATKSAWAASCRSTSASSYPRRLVAEWKRLWARPTPFQF